jgi:hypothetical protein
MQKLSRYDVSSEDADKAWLLKLLVFAIAAVSILVAAQSLQ